MPNNLWREVVLLFAPLEAYKRRVVLFPALMIALGVWIDSPWLIAVATLLAVYHTAILGLKLTPAAGIVGALGTPKLDESLRSWLRFASAVFTWEAFVGLIATWFPLGNNPRWIPVAIMAPLVLTFASAYWGSHGVWSRRVVTGLAVAALLNATMAILLKNTTNAIGAKRGQVDTTLASRVNGWDLETQGLLYPLRAAWRRIRPASHGKPATPISSTSTLVGTATAKLELKCGLNFPSSSFEGILPAACPDDVWVVVPQDAIESNCWPKGDVDLAVELASQQEASYRVDWTPMRATERRPTSVMEERRRNLKSGTLWASALGFRSKTAVEVVCEFKKGGA